MGSGTEYSRVQPPVLPAADADADRDRLVAAQARASYVAGVSTELTGTLNLRRTVLKLLHLTRPALADWTMLAVLEPHGTKLRVFGGVDETFSAFAPVPTDVTSGLGKVLRTGQRELLRLDLHAGLDVLVEELRGQLARLGCANVLCLALPARGSIFGVLVLARAPDRTFTEPDVLLAEEIAGMAAAVLDSARLYEDRTRVASVLQASLRPPALPEIPGVHLAARFRPAAAHMDIGGDFYDVHGGDDDWLLVVGDVCGKGVEAAVLTGRARQSIRTAAQFDRRPSAILSALNAVLYEEDSDRFVTAVCIRLRPRNGAATRVDVAVAGHPPPVVVRADGAVEQPAACGTLAGVLADVQYQDVTVHIDAGDTVLMFTDGVYEARSPAGFYGMERLLRLIPAFAGSGPEALCEAVEQDVVQYLDGGAHDDMALLALARARDVR